jgi:hypothetical protein
MSDKCDQGGIKIRTIKFLALVGRPGRLRSDVSREYGKRRLGGICGVNAVNLKYQAECEQSVAKYGGESSRDNARYSGDVVQPLSI